MASSETSTCSWIKYGLFVLLFIILIIFYNTSATCSSDHAGGFMDIGKLVCDLLGSLIDVLSIDKWIVPACFVIGIIMLLVFSAWRLTYWRAHINNMLDKKEEVKAKAEKELKKLKKAKEQDKKDKMMLMIASGKMTSSALTMGSSQLSLAGAGMSAMAAQKFGAGMGIQPVYENGYSSQTINGPMATEKPTSAFGGIEKKSSEARKTEKQSIVAVIDNPDITIIEHDD